MNENQAFIVNFYQAFQHKNVSVMQSAYSDSATFNDPIFKDLNANEVRAMWEMLIRGAKDMRINVLNISANQTEVFAEWEAHYTFSQTGRPVVNRIKSAFVIKDQRIISQTDSFNFYQWASQALGWPGKLLGYTGFFKDKVRSKARNNLARFISGRQSG